jgi:superkiller protein 3
VHHNLGASLLRRGEPAAAEAHFRAALERKPSAPTYAGLGLALYQQGQVDEAIASLQDGIAADPTHPAAYEQLGAILTEQGRLEEAAANLEAQSRMVKATR